MSEALPRVAAPPPVRRWGVRALAAIGALALIAATVAAFLAYLRPELILDFANSFYLCS